MENYLIEHCAPTLAGMKTAGLFSYRFTSGRDVEMELLGLNKALNEKGVYMEAMLWKEDYVLIYTYRKSHLEKDLAKTDVKELLNFYGYPVGMTDGDIVTKSIEYLKERLALCDGFPHEIGVFLGYPFEDVVGFIVHKGRDCKCSGLWKVYCNEYETMQLFEKIKKCTRVYLQVFAEGRNITQMTVSA